MNRLLAKDKQIPEKTPADVASRMKDAGAHGNFPEEIKHLEEIKAKLTDALGNYEETVKRYDQEYMDSKRYLANFRHEIDPKEMFQNEMALKQIESVGIHAVQRRDRIVKLVDSPYFARIDFRKEGDQAAAIFYIGRFSFSDTDQSRILIYDWRTPISGMFYDCELGRADYFDSNVKRA
jgi:DNA helicase-2/ATP-dependent DNA helicase PcrA